MTQLQASIAVAVGLFGCVWALRRGRRSLFNIISTVVFAAVLLMEALKLMHIAAI